MDSPRTLWFPTKRCSPMTSVRPFLIAVSLVAAGWPLAPAAEPVGQKAKEPDQVSYYRDVRRIFQQQCQGCHQPAKAQGSFVMTSHAALLEKGDSGEPGVVPGKPELSKIVAQITSQED